MHGQNHIKFLVIVSVYLEVGHRTCRYPSSFDFRRSRFQISARRSDILPEAFCGFPQSVQKKKRWKSTWNYLAATCFHILCYIGYTELLTVLT